MESILVDASLLAIPNYTSNPDDASAVFDRIAHLVKIISTPIALQVVVSEETSAVLWGNNLGPDPHSIAEFLQLFEIENVYSANDLANLYTTILDRSKKLEFVGSVVVSELSSFSISPDFPLGATPSDLIVESEKSYSNVVALEKLFGGWWVCSSFPFLAGTVFEVNAKVEQATGQRVSEFGHLPFELHGTARQFKQFSDLVSNDVGARIWSGAIDEHCLHLAITVKALELCKVAGKPFSSLIDFKIGPNFKKSLVDTQCFGEGRFSDITLTHCAQIVAQVSNKVKGQFGKPNQRIREFDKCRGWRVHLTKGSEGLRLMYWENVNHIEFANVGVKMALKIEDGWLGGGITCDIKKLIE